MKLSVPKMLTTYNPYVYHPWGLDVPIMPEEIDDAIAVGNFLSPEIASSLSESMLSKRPIHIAKIAWFVMNGWKDSIVLDLYCPWPIQDGSHRYFAAIYRNDQIIEAEIHPNSKDSLFLNALVDDWRIE